MPDTTTWNDRGKLMKVALDADQTERAALTNGTAPVESGAADDLKADVHHADDITDSDEWIDEDNAIERVSAPITEEIDRRTALLGNAYPFERVGSTLKYCGSFTHAYEFCLATSLLRDLSTRPFNQIPVTFERLSAVVAQIYLGPTAVSWRTGVPSHDHTLRPTRIKGMFELLHRETGEFIWNPRPPHTIASDPGAPGDEGLDFVVWQRPPDLRTGSLFLLGQCACGGDWENKFSDLDQARLDMWLNPTTLAPYVRVFAVPHHIPGHYVFETVTQRAGITLDRVRITALAESNPALILGELGEVIERAHEVLGTSRYLRYLPHSW